MDRKRFTVIRGGRDIAPAVPERSVDLTWAPRDRWRRTVELRRDDEVVGVLRRIGLTGCRAEVKAAGITWVLDRPGLASPAVTVQCDGTEIGVCEDDELRLHSGRFRRVQGRWLDDTGKVLVRDRGERLRLEPAGLTVPEHLLLALLGEYLKQVEGEPPEER